MNADSEPADGSFLHKPSGRFYRVYRQGGQFRHEEVIRTPEGKEIARVDLPMRYLIGSGNFSRTYIVEVDGFLHESPITWYSSKNKWDMSPGYDSAVHDSFERPVSVDCLACHSGRAAPVDGSAHRVAFHEQAIGCENCHGPGSLHQELRRRKNSEMGADDFTIVNPRKLSRGLSEAICATCHLSGPATIELRGRQAGDFRPGMPLTDYRIPYRFEGTDQMTVVGHVEQMHLSACYQKTESLTCLTCHDPHQSAAPKDKTAFFRQKCLNCHENQPCRLETAERLKKDGTDNCVACHMPRGDTDIPHIAFTHHRIGRHSRQSAAEPEGILRLAPAYDDSHLSDIDRRRNLGLAYLQSCFDPKYVKYASAFRERAMMELTAVEKAGLNDADTLVGLAQLFATITPNRACDYARRAIEANDLSPKLHSLALMVIASRDFQEGNYAEAAKSLEELVRLFRTSEHWRTLGICYLRMNQSEKALDAMKKAREIRPFRPAIYLGLADVYRRMGDEKNAIENIEVARWLKEHGQD